MTDRTADEQALAAAMDDIETQGDVGYARAWAAGLYIQPVSRRRADRAAMAESNDYSAVAAAVLSQMNHETPEYANGEME